MKKYSLFLLIVIFAGVAKAQINYTNFESYADETSFTKTSWESEGFTLPWVNGFDKSRGYVDNAFAHSGTKSLRIKYPAGTYGPTDNGAQAPLTVTPANELYMSYWVRFSDDFDWGGSSEGGKLPGLGGGERCSGCKVCTGSNGFTARLMWRTGGKATLYLYHIEADKINPPCGDDRTLKSGGSDFYFKKGQWYNIIERVKVNTGSNHDGEVELWINEEQVILVTGIQFVSNGDKVDALYFSTFHGGNSASWAPSVDCYTWFDEIKIAAKAEDVFTVTGLKKLRASNDLSIYPNPVKKGSQINLELNTNTSYQLEWRDITGKVVSNSFANPGTTSIQVPDLSEGVYVLRLVSEEGVIIKKIVVE